MPPTLQPIRLALRQAAVALLLTSWLHTLASAAEPAAASSPRTPPGLAYVDTGFENASPVWHEIDADGVIQIHLLYLERMKRLEALLRKHTWFTEGSRPPTARNVGTLADGWLERYGIPAAVHEFNCQWIAGLKTQPTARHWKEYGTNLARVLFEYFDPPTASGNR